jgi:DNA helicase-2/ATP-dependent DNA helicase PcrA
MNPAKDPSNAVLTSEQLAAIATDKPRVFIEAEPGSGKTTVAAQRFGVVRYRATPLAESRGVIAVSFTRSATWELRGRVAQSWGPSALVWPHRIITLDTLVYELLRHLLVAGEVIWPGGHKELDVRDSWKVLADFKWRNVLTRVDLVGGKVVVRAFRAAKGAARPDPGQVAARVGEGSCTHEEVRRILGQALKDGGIRTEVVRRMRAGTRAMIVDEVFDANELDLAIIELAVDAGMDVTAVGDPWQALYGFRGATPEAVPALIHRVGMSRLPLRASFRWRTDAQRDLAEDLRAGRPVAVPAGQVNVADVVLACRWQQLWDVGPEVLPLAFGSAKGNAPEAAATILLNHVTRSVLHEDATYLGDALMTLGIDDLDAIGRMEDPLESVAQILQSPSKSALNSAYDALVSVVGAESPRAFPKAHGAYTRRLELLRMRLQRKASVIPGMTTHQAKGREWENVAIALSEEEQSQLASGLSHGVEAHRQLYVGCTRARRSTAAV